MPVSCPYCHHTLSLKGARPGRYSTNCTRCQRKFHLTIPDAPDEPPVARPIAAEAAKPAPIPPESNAAETIPAPQPGAVAGDPGSTATVAAPPTIPGPSPPAGADTVVTAPPEPPPTASVAGLPANSTLGGYQIVKELGRGGMGAVYLARQLSLNRYVALKVMRPEWGRNAAFVARFTREAYAAAQLNHHNVVQIYDFGEDRGTAYFSMEYVDGTNLAGLVRQKSRLDIEEAVGYILQAARGLKFAHDQSMVHRDVKPENLLLNTHGIVKVADLGLVKTPEVAEAEERDAALAQSGGGPAPTGAIAGPAGWPAAAAAPASITITNVAMGTPAFMAPEQAIDAAHVDHRADIYALGCTLYDLVTGRPPFEGRTAVEVLTKHQTEPMPPAETVVKRVPRALSAIIQRMTAKQPAARHRDLGEVIRALEGFLGVDSAAPFTPREEHANQVEEAARAFNAAPSARLRRYAIPASALLCAGLAVLALFLRRPVAVGAFLGLGLMTALADFLIAGFRRQTPLFLKARALAATTPLGEWLMVAAGVLVTLGALWVFKLFWIWMFLAVVAVGVAVCLNAILDRKLDDEQRGPLEQVEPMLRSMRLQGLDEDALRQFVCKYSGDDWEPFFEALFGYEAKLEARRRWGRGDRARSRRRAGVWREPIAAWIDARVKARREAAERAKIEKIEERGLVAQGVNEMTARRKARRAAEAMVTLAAEIKESVNTRDDATIPVNRAISRSLREAATQPERVLVDREHGLTDERRFRPADLLDWVIGPRPRFLAGAALLAGCLGWMHQNDLLNAEQARTLQAAALKAAEAAKNLDTSALSAEAQAVARRAAEDARKAQAVPRTEPLRTRFLPPWLAQLVSSFGAGAGGLILIISSFFRGSKMALFALPAAAIPVLGPALGLPPIGPLDRSVVPAAAGAALFVAGVLFGRSKRP